MIKKTILLLIFIGYVGSTQPVIPSWIMPSQRKIEKINLVVMAGLSSIKEVLYKLWAKTRFCKKQTEIGTSVVKPDTYLTKLAIIAKSAGTFLQQHPVACGLTALAVGGCTYGYRKYVLLRNDLYQKNATVRQENEALIQALGQNTALLDSLREEF